MRKILTKNNYFIGGKKMKFKKLLLVAIMITSMVAVTACGGNTDGEQPVDNPENPPVTDETLSPDVDEPEDNSELNEPENPDEATDPTGDVNSDENAEPNEETVTP